MKNPFDKNLDEFGWEREIRKDEARIHRYMSELHNFLDLPGEEEMIIKSLQKNPELIPQKAEPGSLPFSEFFDDYEDDFIYSEEWQKKDGSEIYFQLEKLAYHWNAIFASELKKENMAQGMKITCLYGKLLARSTDLLDINAEDFPALRIAICKRLISDFNKIAGEFNKMEDLEPALKILFETHKSHIHILREKIMSLMDRIREKKDKK